MDQVAKHIIFTGRVQGVGFRFTAYSIARRCQLTGFVRNLPNGSVEMLAQGRAEGVSDCIGDLKETFRVNEAKVNEVPFEPKYIDFRITF